jgi:hypothetical protein
VVPSKVEVDLILSREIISGVEDSLTDILYNEIKVFGSPTPITVYGWSRVSNFMWQYEWNEHHVPDSMVYSYTQKLGTMPYNILSIIERKMQRETFVYVLEKSFWYS